MTPDGLRALVVEDDRSWQAILGEILGDAGLRVDVANSLAEAQARMRLSSYRIAIVDLSLGGRDHHNQDGLRVLDELRLHNPGCVSLLLTGFATVELAVSALTEHSAFTCLRKEVFRRSQFKELIQQALASHPAAAGEAAPLVAAPSFRTAAQADDIPPRPDARHQRPALVLVVEDDAGWRSIFAELLQGAGFGVRLCSSFGEALGQLRRELFDAAVIDLSLANSLPASSSWNKERSGSNLDGYRLLASTRAGSIPTIVVSGVALPADIEQAYTDYAIFAYFQKQVFNRQAYLQAVSEAVALPHSSGELDVLSPREREVLKALAQGMTNKEIAEALVISTNTVKRHLKAIFEKLDIHTRAAAAAKAAGREK